MLSCGVWRVLSPGKQSSGPGAAGSCGAESRLDSTKTRKHNETDWLAAGSAGRESGEGPRPQSGPGRLSALAGLELTQDRGTPGVRGAARARTLTLRPWVRTDGAPVRARHWPSQHRLNPQQTFSYRQSVDPSYERWNVRNVIMFLINR